MHQKTKLEDKQQKQNLIHSDQIFYSVLNQYCFNFLIITQQLLYQIQIRSMKSQLQRILKSDLSEYKIAISDHITNLDQFQECITQRQTFIQNFNQMLKSELQKMERHIKSSSEESADQQNKQEISFNKQVEQRYNKAQKQLLINTKIEQKVLYESNIRKQGTQNLYKNQVQLNYQSQRSNQVQIVLKDNNSTNTPQIIFISPKNKEKSNISLNAHKLKLTVLTIHHFFAKVRKGIYDSIEQTKNNIIKDINSNLRGIVNKIDSIYQQKMNKLQQDVQYLRKQNQRLKIQKQNLQERVLKYQKKRQCQPRNLKTFQNQNQKQMCSVSINKQKIFSPIWMIQKSHNQISDRFQENQFYQSYQKQLSQQKISSYSYSASCQTSQRKQVDNSDQIFISTSKFPKEQIQMTIQNNSKVVWKHFKCNLSDLNFQQAQSQRNQAPIDPVKCVSSTFTGPNEFKFITKQNCTFNQILCERQPNLPVLLRRNTNEKQSYKNYNIPAIKSLSVAHPPVQQGFSILKVGNEIMYKGMWKFRKFHGKGILTLIEYSYDGDFQFGLFHGRGTLKIKNIQYMGQFRQNKAEGEGRLKIGSKIISGRWKNNCLIQLY